MGILKALLFKLYTLLHHLKSISTLSVEAGRTAAIWGWLAPVDGLPQWLGGEESACKAGGTGDAPRYGAPGFVACGSAQELLHYKEIAEGKKTFFKAESYLSDHHLLFCVFLPSLQEGHLESDKSNCPLSIIQHCSETHSPSFPESDLCQFGVLKLSFSK